VVVILLTGSMAIACSRGDRWMATVYPSGSVLGPWRNLGEFESLEACRAAARTYIADLGASGRGTYECGKNCRKTPGTIPGLEPTYICEETLT
jgi:hypothetical protein